MRVLFALSGFTQYMARAIGALVAHSNFEYVVVATRPKVPVRGMEELCGCPVYWLEDLDSFSLRQRLGSIPEVLIVDGWGIRQFNDMRDEVRASKGRVYAMVDNNFIFSVKEIVKSIRFRLMYARKYNGYMVPGNSGIKLLGFYGVPRRKIVKGMYSADSRLFRDTIPINKRDRKIIFVGQLCDRKNIIAFVNAFLNVNRELRIGWRLEICGCGPQKDMIPHDPSIEVHDFVQPEQLAAMYQNAKIFCLPSKEEHWGVVVHEAALSGCALLLSRQVGAAEDLLGRYNGVSFDAYSQEDMVAALMKCLSYSHDAFEHAETESLELASRIALDNFVEGCMKMIGGNL